MITLSIRRSWAAVLLAAAGLAAFSPLHAAGRSCGTAWTGWVDEADPAKNPCPAKCTRGERLKERTHKQGARTQYDVQYQCYFAEADTKPAAAPSSAAAAGGAKPAAATPSARPSAARVADDYPLIKGSPAEPGAPQGDWIGWHDLFLTEVNQPPTAAAKLWEPSLRALATIVRESPALKDLGGFYPQIYVGVDTSAQPVPSGRLTLNPWWPYAVEPDPTAKAGEKRLRIKSKYLMNRPGGLALYVNWFPTGPAGRSDGLDKLPWTEDADGKFFLMPQAPEREIAGFPVRGGYLFVTPAGKPPLFLPVSQERAYKAAIHSLRGQIKSVGEGNAAGNEALATYNSPEMKDIRRKVIEEAAARHKDPARAAAARRKAEADDRAQEEQLRGMAGKPTSDSPITQAVSKAIASLEARLKAMSDAQRRAPAHVKNDPESLLIRELVPAGTEGAVPLMEFNRNYFDAKLPAGTLQLLVMRAQTREELPEPHKQTTVTRVAIAVTEQTDWRKAAAMMK